MKYSSSVIKFLAIPSLSAILLSPIAAHADGLQSGLKAEVGTFEGIEEAHFLPFDELPVRDFSLYSPCPGEGAITTSPNLDMPDVDYEEVAGCQLNFVMVRLTGFITLPIGNYTFSFNGDDGMFLSIDGEILTNDAEDWILKSSGGSEDVPFSVTSDEPLPLEYWYYEYWGESFAEVVIRDSEGNVVDQSNIYTHTTQPPAPTSASSVGPVGLRLTETLRSCEGSTWTLSGDHLDAITQTRVAGSDVALTRISDQKLSFEVPKGLAAGQHKISFFVGSNLATELTHTLNLKSEVNCNTSLIRFTGLNLGQAQLGPSNSTELNTYLESGIAPKRVICTGSAHSWESNNAEKLALKRAEGACRLVKQLFPRARVQSYGFVSRIMSPSYQAVAIRVDR